MLSQFSHSSAVVRNVQRVQFGVLSPQEIKAMSVCEITNPGTFNNGRPIKGGLADPALGTCDKRTTCFTCKNTYAGSQLVNDCVRRTPAA
jgi:DNA-directed RNA polymerase II subunit RPB1